MVYRMAVRVYWPLWNDVSLAHNSSFLPGEKCSLVTESERALVCAPTSFMWALRTIRLGCKTAGPGLGVYKQVARSQAFNSFPEKCRYHLDVLQLKGELLQ